MKLFLRLYVSLLRQYSDNVMAIAFLTLVVKTGQPTSYCLKSSLVVVLEREKRCTCVCLRIADSTHTTCICHTKLRCKDFVFYSILLARLYLPDAAVDVWNVVLWLTFFAAARRGFVVSTHSEQIERSFETLRHIYELYI